MGNRKQAQVEVIEYTPLKGNVEYAVNVNGIRNGDFITNEAAAAVVKAKQIVEKTRGDYIGIYTVKEV